MARRSASSLGAAALLSLLGPWPGGLARAAGVPPGPSALDSLTADDLDVARKKSRQVAEELQDAMKAEKDAGRRDALTEKLAHERARLRALDGAALRMKKRPLLDRLLAEGEIYRVVLSNMLEGQPTRVDAASADPKPAAPFDAYPLKQQETLRVRLGSDAPLKDTRLYTLYGEKELFQGRKFFTFSDGLLAFDFRVGVTAEAAYHEIRSLMRLTLQRAAALGVPDPRLTKLADWCLSTRAIWKTSYPYTYESGGDTRVDRSRPLHFVEGILSDRQYRELNL